MNGEHNGQVFIDTPQWLKEEKFGIYTHWGIYSVHACGPNTTWYAHHLYKGSAKERDHFEAHYGSFGSKGYTDLIPLLTASKFDADEWADLFHSAGARFAGPVVIHHDGFAMWKTQTTPFNAWDMGPKRDVVGEMEKALRAKGMRYLTAFHHAENYWFLPRMAGTDAEKAENEYMFSKEGKWPYEKFCKLWLDQCKEVFVRYHPDIIYFDFGLKEIPDAWKKKMMQDYLQMAESCGIDPALCYKNLDMMPGSGLIDLEQGRFSDLRYHDWITDTTVDAGEAWGYMEGSGYKSGAQLVQYLVDNVSKNGYLLLNVGPSADGTIPREARQSLMEIGEWLRVNGEAIYGTHPWYAYGEGPTQMKKAGMFSESEELQYTPEDIRYTAKDNSLYATILSRPCQEVLLREVVSHLIPKEILSVQLLGYDRPLAFQQEGAVLKVEFPADAAQQVAYTLKIQRDPIIVKKFV